MKCPKCNYTSFDYLDACKRCGADLRDVRTLLNLITVSPEERAVAPPAGAPAPEPGPLEEPSGLEGPAASFEDFGDADRPVVEPVSPGTEGDEEILSDIDFEGSFEELVEPTRYEQAEADEGATRPAPEDEELLELDFGDLFADGEKESEEKGSG